jgi:hypothetical protein
MLLGYQSLNTLRQNLNVPDLTRMIAGAPIYEERFEGSFVGLRAAGFRSERLLNVLGRPVLVSPTLRR